MRITCGNSRGGGNMILIRMSHDYKNIISIENLCDAWTEFIRGKKSKKDVAEFSLNLSQNIFRLHEELRTKTYRHGAYEAFSISDPKPRSIHKATVRDRLLHHAIYRVLYPYFDKKFIHDSYSCRQLKGTHRALNRFNDFVLQVSQSNSRTCWVLKCDVKKFFASIDQATLMNIFKRHINNADTIWLIERTIESFQCKVPLSLDSYSLKYCDCSSVRCVVQTASDSFSAQYEFSYGYTDRSFGIFHIQALLDHQIGVGHQDQS